MNIPNQRQREELQETYEGKRIKLLDMPHDHAPVPPGTEGTCTGVDGIGNLLMQWDNGSTLSLIYGIDKFQVI